MLRESLVGPQAMDGPDDEDYDVEAEDDEDEDD
jgi:hypothetical protein